MQRWNEWPRQWLLIHGKTGDTVYKDIAFISPVELILFFIRLVGGCVHTEFTVPIRFWLVIRLTFKGEKGLGIIVWRIGRNGSGIQSDERCVDNAFFGKKQNLWLHNPTTPINTGSAAVLSFFNCHKYLISLIY